MRTPKRRKCTPIKEAGDAFLKEALFALRIKEARVGKRKQFKTG